MSEDPATKQEWRADRPRFRLWEWGATGALLGGVIVFAVEDHYRPPLFHGGILFDDSVRNALRATTPEGRERAHKIGTDLYLGSFGFSVADALIGSWAVRGSADVAGQVLLMDTEAYALVGFLQFLAAATVRRERPYEGQCRQGISEGFPGCSPNNADGSKSFFAGHTAIASTNAGLTCAHHTNLTLYGSIGDPAICGLAIASAFVVAYTRIAADKHYATDDLTGMILGASSGYLLPVLLHYRSAGVSAPTQADVVNWKPRILGVLPTPSPQGVSVQMVGLF